MRHHVQKILHTLYTSSKRKLKKDKRILNGIKFEKMNCKEISNNIFHRNQIEIRASNNN